MIESPGSGSSVNVIVTWVGARSRMAPSAGLEDRTRAWALALEADSRTNAPVRKAAATVRRIDLSLSLLVPGWGSRPSPTSADD
jgi:hypothetical protein